MLHAACCMPANRSALANADASCKDREDGSTRCSKAGSDNAATAIFRKSYVDELKIDIMNK
jgi:hypothetical protein